MEATESQAHAELTVKLQALEPGSQRHGVVAAAHKFKASWLELAQRLAELKHSGAFTGWGFADFAAYCRKELHIREQTADKLTRSYRYLRERAPAVLDASPEAARALPPLDVVSLLSQARERTKVSGEALQALEGEVLGGEASPSRGQLLRKLRKMDPEAFRGQPGADAAPETAQRPSLDVDAHQLRKVVLLAERLEELLQQLRAGLAPQLVASAAALAEGLRGQLSELQAAEPASPRGAAMAPGELPPASPMH